MKLLSPRDTCALLRALWQFSRSRPLRRAQLEAAQRRKFRRLVAFVRARSPYYRSVIDERGIDPATCSPADFPPLTKSEVIEHFDRIVTDPRITRERIKEFLSRSVDPLELFEGEFHVLHTSGTSGTMAYFVFSPEAWIKGSSQIMRMVPLRLRQRIAFVAATRGHFAGVSLMLVGNHGANKLFYDVRTYDVNMPMSQIVAALNEFQPHLLSGYAAVLKALAAAQTQGQLRIRPTLIGNGGEPMSSELKSQLERVFAVPVANAYASSEHLYMGLTLPGSRGMSLLEDDLIFELHDDHTCVTNLFNYTMPLIRYQMDDVLVPDLDGPARHSFTRIREVVGRHEDGLVFTNRHGLDDFIHPIVIVEFIVRGLHSWQIVLLDQTSFIFRARFEPDRSDFEKQAIRRQIREKMTALLVEKEMDNVTFEIEEVETLPIDSVSGKFRLVVRRPPGVARVSSRNRDEPSDADELPVTANHLAGSL
jgi:phenylacetate-coenzyme A ligase PaaK-like adenylate-forming protein